MPGLDDKRTVMNKILNECRMNCLSSGIKWDKTMANKLMYTPNDDTQNYPFSRLQLEVETFGHSTNQNLMKFPKVVKPTNKKTLL